MDIKVPTQASDVDEYLESVAIQTFESWFDNDDPIDWESFIDRMSDPNGFHINNGVGYPFDFEEYDNPAIRKIQRIVRAYKNQG